MTQTNQANSEENPISSSVQVEPSRTYSAEEQNRININSTNSSVTNETTTKVKQIAEQQEEQQRKEKSQQVKFVGSVLQMCCDLLTHCITLRPETLSELIDEVKATSVNTSTTSSSSSISLTNRWASKRTRSDVAAITTTDKVALTSIRCTSNVHPLESTLLHSLIECAITLNSSSELQAVYEAINSCCVSLLPVFSFMYDRTTPLRRREIVNFWLSGKWNLESNTAIVINKNRNRYFTVTASTNSYGSVKTENVENTISYSDDSTIKNKEEHNEQNKKRRLENNNNNDDINATNHITTSMSDDGNDDYTTTSVKLDSMDKCYDNNKNNNQLCENNYNAGGVGVTRTGINGSMETTCASFTPPLLRLFDFISFQLKQYICTFSSLPMNLHKSEEQEHFNATQNLLRRKAVERQVQYALKVINVIISSPAAAVSSVESMWYDRHENKQDNISVNIDHIIALLLSESLLLPAVGSVLRIHHRSACNLQSSLLSFLALLVTRSNVKITKLLGSPLTQLCSSPSSVNVLPNKDMEKEKIEYHEENSSDKLTNNDVMCTYNKRDDNHYDDKKKKDSIVSVLESTMILLLHYAHRGNVISGAVQHLFSVLCDNVHHEKAAMASSSHNSSMEMRHGNSLEFKNNSYYDILHDYQPSPVHNNKQHHHRSNNSNDDYYYENDNDYVDDINNNNEEENEEEQSITNSYDDKENEYHEDDDDDDEDERDEEEATSAIHGNEEVIGGNINSENKKECKPLVSTLTASALLHQASSSEERHAKKRPRSHDKYDSIGNITSTQNNNSTKNEEINNKNKKKKIYRLYKRPVCYQSILSSLMSKYGASLARVAPLLHHKLREALTESPTEAQRQLDAESSSIASTLERSFAASSSSSSSSSSSGANIGSTNLPREYEAVAFEFGIDPRTGRSPSPPLHTNTEPVPVDDPEQALREIQIENEDTMGSLFSDEEEDDDENEDKSNGGDKNADEAVSNSNSNINSKTAYTNITTCNKDIDDLCKDIGGVENNNIHNKDVKSESCVDSNNSIEEENATVNSNSIGVELYTDMTNTTKPVLCTTNNDNVNKINTEILKESTTSKMQHATPSVLSSYAEDTASPLEQQEEKHEESYQEKDCQQDENVEQVESEVNTSDNENIDSCELHTENNDIRHERELESINKEVENEVLFLQHITRIIRKWQQFFL